MNIIIRERIIKWKAARLQKLEINYLNPSCMIGFSLKMGTETFHTQIALRYRCTGFCIWCSRREERSNKNDWSSTWTWNRSNASDWKPSLKDIRKYTRNKFYIPQMKHSKKGLNGVCSLMNRKFSSIRRRRSTKCVRLSKIWSNSSALSFRRLWYLIK